MHRIEVHQRERIKLSLRASQCPLWVISGHFAVQSSCPLISRANHGPNNGFPRLLATGRQTKEQRTCVKQSWVQQVP
jgi:hypothetical protein